MEVMKQHLGACAAVLWLSAAAAAQVIQFESNGLKYQTLTRSGVTVMFAPLNSQVRDFSIIQVSVSNGSAGPYVIKPEDFAFVQAGGETRAWPARAVVGRLIERGSRGDVIKLVSTYEAALYGAANRMRSTNGYEARRQAALAEVSSTKLKAAAAASAIALVQTKLAPGESTDGAVFFQVDHTERRLAGRLVVRTNTDTFEFNPE